MSQGLSKRDPKDFGTIALITVKLYTNLSNFTVNISPKWLCFSTKIKLMDYLYSFDLAQRHLANQNGMMLH
jgi:hypothetical protein